MRQPIELRIQKALNAEYREDNSLIIEKTIKQITEYFANNRTVFDIPLKLIGTNFQQKVWKQLINNPFGQTSSYLQLPRDLENEKAIRAIASANGANAISIIVPCHRIIGSDGKLVGYAGGLDTKKKLLKLEAKEKYHEQLELF